MRNAFISLVALMAIFAAGQSRASDVPDCTPYCSGGDFYTDGFAECAGTDCYCNYNVISKAANCTQDFGPDDFPMAPEDAAPAEEPIFTEASN